MAKGSKLKTSDSRKNAYKRYALENRQAKNKKAKVARHLKQHPNDAQSANAIKSSISYTRNKDGKTKARIKDPKDQYKLAKYHDNKPYPKAKRIRPFNGDDPLWGGSTMQAAYDIAVMIRNIESMLLRLKEAITGYGSDL